MKSWLLLFTLSLSTLSFAQGRNTSIGPTQVKGAISFPVYKIYRTNTIHSSDNVATLTSGVDNDLYYTDSLGKQTHLYLNTLFNGSDSGKRLPLNISIVIDKSGSMEGVKMGNAKRAAKAIIDQLAPEDFVSIVAFDNYVDTILSPTHIQDKEALKKRINTIVPMGGTNLWGGTGRGYNFVRRNASPHFINRVFLLSDGGANIGLIDPERIKDSVDFYKQNGGITISTFGIGLDFNERLLTEMAGVGAGHFYYIDQPTQLVTALQRELNVISRVSARNAVLQVVLPAQVQVIEPLPPSMHLEGQRLWFKWGDVFADESKELLITLRYVRRATSPILITTELRYTDVRTGQQKALTSTLTLTGTAQKAAYTAHFDREVIEKVIFTTGSGQLEQAINRTDEGNMDEAVSLLKANTDYLGQQRFYTSGNIKLARLDSLNQSYLQQLGNIGKEKPDSLKRLQKVVRTANYQLVNQ